MWLFQYKKVNQHENHHSGTWGDAEQEMQKTVLFLFYGFFKNKNILQTNFKCFIETVMHYEYN